MKYETLIETLTEAIATYYVGDASTAGLVVAKLPLGTIGTRDVGSWYVSIVRYREPLGRGKILVCSATSSTLREALVAVATDWFGRTAPAMLALDEVSDMLKRFEAK